jgi:hypothetical protein
MFVCGCLSSKPMGGLLDLMCMCVMVGICFSSSGERYNV